MKKETVLLRRSIWPDIDGPEEINKYLKELEIEVKFLLDDGILFSYNPEILEPYKIGEGTLYFKDPMTKDILFHYYEDIGDLVFESRIKKDKLRIRIFEDIESYDI